MTHQAEFTPTIERQLKKLKKKDRILFARLTKKIEAILDNPEHYKPLKNLFKGTRRAHLDPFIIIFSLKEDTVIFHHVKHHDTAYRR